jgi:hypothetical protein
LRMTSPWWTLVPRRARRGSGWAAGPPRLMVVCWGVILTAMGQSVHIWIF